ncbi:hypothetical protein [Gardnerella vaginalis]|uniref:hypothetical protein n=1 Tax=Gardnerella TaxID=2701 RepID=UPI000C7C3364|nr:hypothetical protein [Gardnerella vaginalis]NSX30030.1 hypothetical protein [Gardnerella vaginalis]PKZ47477.1 hypothetical protein CYJ67_01625 [Gardnerella vaginalis]PKZ57617.1 hypothetical protein CYJ63_01350 [Gardnerella vaginalis]PKZ74640.1 hypothetical protein CYJ65_05300 [Gardnerella vaginalis]PMC50014.1 hypothetical protein CJ212_04550 [Gardnerella vaginalis]
MFNKIPVCEDCSNLQIKAYKECMCKKILDLIGAYIGFFYIILVAIPLSAMFIFNTQNKQFSSFLFCFCFFLSGFNIYAIHDYSYFSIVYVNYFVLIFYVVIILFFFIYSHYKIKKVCCKEIYDYLYDDLRDNRMYMYASTMIVFMSITVHDFICYRNSLIPNNSIVVKNLVVNDDFVISNDFAINKSVVDSRQIVAVAILLISCFIGVRMNIYKNKSYSTKIDLDDMTVTDKYLKSDDKDKEGELFIKKSMLKYYKTMETNYQLLLLFFTFLTSVFSLKSFNIF